MERVLLPMEPVEPRIANFFTSFIFSEWSGGVLLDVSPGVPPGMWGILGVSCLLAIVYRGLWSLKYSI